MREITEQMIRRQVDMEQEMLELGVARYRERARKAKEYRDQSSTQPGGQLVSMSLDIVTEQVRQFFEAAQTGRAGRRHVAYKFIRDLEPEIIAFITARVCVNALTEEVRLQSIAMGIGRAIYDEIALRAFKEQKPHLMQNVLDSVNIEQLGANLKQARLKRSISRYGIETPEWSPSDMAKVGFKCLDFIMVTGWFETKELGRRNNKSQVVFRATDATIEWFRDSQNRLEWMSPILLPMICPPVEWTSPFNGGYLSGEIKRQQLVKTRNKIYLRELMSVEMPVVYQAINRVQSTAWKINNAILEVMEAAHEAQSGLGGLPHDALLELPPFPLDQVEDKDVVRAWKAEATNKHQANAKIRSRIVAFHQGLFVAQKFRDEPAIYFPHFLDFRGRMYPRSLYLTPQGEDWCKGLLHFADGKPLGESGAAWLAIHGANLYGVDKVSFEDRIRWVEDRQVEILDAAQNPLDSRFWTEADKPYQFLAFCFEWAGYLKHGQSYVSHLPIALDGSCNGLQNFSMALRDSVGGAAVNLIPQDKPADIYGTVAEVVRDKVAALALEGDELAIQWASSGLINRKLTKGPVMTLPYGAKAYGMRDSVAAFIQEQNLKRDIPYFNRDILFAAAGWITSLIWDSIGEVVVAAVEAMRFLQECAQVASRDGLPIYWTAPNGFPVLQEYREEILQTLKTFVGGSRYDLVISNDGERLDKRRQSSGVSPNFVHSLDSSHMMLTINLCAANGVDSFAMIHDSYATHAADSDILAAALRQAFVDMYQANVLADFRAELASQVAPEYADDLPPVPTMGDLDPELVLDSDFFFA